MAGKTPSQVSRWFSDQMSGVVPDWLKAMFFGQPAAVELLFSKDAQKIMRSKGRLIAPLGLLQPGGVEIKSVRSRIVDVTLPESYFLKRTIDAPNTARRNLATLVELDMVRRTPFRPDAVYWVISKPHKTGVSLRVEQWIAKRSDIEELRLRLEKIGLRIRKVFVAGPATLQPVTDLSASVTPNAGRWRLINATLVVGAIILAGAIWLYPAWQASGELAHLNGEIAQHRTKALALRQEVDVLREREQERAAFLDIVYQRPRLSRALRDLTVALPDSVWISNMVFSPKRLVVSGEVSGSAAQLVLALAQRNEFSNPRLSGAVARANNGAERFDLTLDLGGIK